MAWTLVEVVQALAWRGRAADRCGVGKGAK